MPGTAVRQRLLFTAAALVVSAPVLPGVTGGPAPAAAAAAMRSAAPPYAVTRNCDEEQAFVDGSAPAVARVLPRGLLAVRDPITGAPVTYVRALRCAAVTISGRTAPALLASYGVVIQTPDSTGCRRRHLPSALVMATRRRSATGIPSHG